MLSHSPRSRAPEGPHTTSETRTWDTSRCLQKRCATFPQPAFTATHCTCLFINASINTHLSCQLAPPVNRFRPCRSLSRCTLSLSMLAPCYNIYHMTCQHLLIVLSWPRIAHPFAIDVLSCILSLVPFLSFPSFLSRHSL